MTTPIGDISGAASNYIGALRDRAALGQQERGKIVGAAGSMAQTWKDAQDQRALEQALVAAGLDPSLAKDPHAAVSAMIQKVRDKQQRENADAAQQATFGHDTSMEEMRQQGRLAEMRAGSQLRSAEDVANDARAAEDRMGQAKDYTGLMRDAGMGYGGYAPGVGMTPPQQGTPTRTGILSVLGTREVDPRVREQALREFPEQKVEDPSQSELRLAQAVRARAEADKLAAETANVGRTELPASLTEEGKASQLDLEQRRAEQNAARAHKEGSLTAAQRERLIKIRQELQQISRPDPFGRKPTPDVVARMKELNDEHDTIVPPTGKKIGNPAEPNAAGQPVSDAKPAVNLAAQDAYAATLGPELRAKWDKMTPEQRADAMSRMGVGK